MDGIRFQSLQNLMIIGRVFICLRVILQALQARLRVCSANGARNLLDGRKKRNNLVFVTTCPPLSQRQQSYFKLTAMLVTGFWSWKGCLIFSRSLGQCRHNDKSLNQRNFWHVSLHKLIVAVPELCSSPSSKTSGFYNKGLIVKAVISLCNSAPHTILLYFPLNLLKRKGHYSWIPISRTLWIFELDPKLDSLPSAEHYPFIPNFYKYRFF